VVQVDLRGEHIARRVRVDVALVGTVKDTIRALLSLLATSRDAAHLKRMQADYRHTRKRLDALASSHGDTGAIHPQLTTTALDKVAADDAVFTVDVGTPTDLGHAVPDDERTAPAARLVQPRNDG
jgi:pyruvate dehydrogenase (quinone)